MQRVEGVAGLVEEGVVVEVDVVSVVAMEDLVGTEDLVVVGAEEEEEGGEMMAELGCHLEYLEKR